MCIGSNSVNQAQDLMFVTKFEGFPNSLLPIMYVVLYWKILTRNLHHPCVLAGMGSVTCIQVKTLMN